MVKPVSSTTEQLNRPSRTTPQQHGVVAEKESEWLLISAGVDARKAKILAGEFPSERITAVVKKAKSGIRTSIPGFIVSALKENWNLRKKTYFPPELGIDESEHSDILEELTGDKIDCDDGEMPVADQKDNPEDFYE